MTCCLRRLAAALLLLGLAFPAGALPRASSVPGGVALIRLGAVSGDSRAPHARFGEQPVLVAAEGGQWFAVLGLALDLVPGPHELIVDEAAGERSLPFEVREKRYQEQHIALKDTSRVTLSDEDASRALAEIATIGQFKRHWRDADDTDSDFRLPAEGRLASRFGLRRVFNGEMRAPHSGLDLAVARGTPVKASAHGQVLAVGDYFFNGKTVFVDHGNGLISMYCHLDRIDVAAGDTLAQGERLGLSGMSGRASGPHLHWSVVLNGVMVDPELFVKR